MVNALSHTRALALAPEQWRVLLGPATADSWNHLLKIAVEVPALLEATESAVKRGYHDNMTTQHKDVLVRKFHELDCWRAQKPVPYWVVPARLENPADDNYDDKLFPFALHFCSITAAVQWMFCSGLMLQCLDAALNLDTLGTTANAPALADSTLSLKEIADKLARQLCQCFEYCHSPDNGTFAAQATYSAQVAVQSYFRHHGHPREIEWSKGIGAMRGALNFRFELMVLGTDD